MDEMKQLYVLEWFGPYKFVEDLWEEVGQVIVRFI